MAQAPPTPRAPRRVRVISLTGSGTDAGTVPVQGAIATVPDRAASVTTVLPPDALAQLSQSVAVPVPTLDDQTASAAQRIANVQLVLSKSTVDRAATVRHTRNKLHQEIDLLTKDELPVVREGKRFLRKRDANRHARVQIESLNAGYTSTTAQLDMEANQLAAHIPQVDRTQITNESTQQTSYSAHQRRIQIKNRDLLADDIAYERRNRIALQSGPDVQRAQAQVTVVEARANLTLHTEVMKAFDAMPMLLDQMNYDPSRFPDYVISQAQELDAVLASYRAQGYDRKSILGQILRRGDEFVDGLFSTFHQAQQAVLRNQYRPPTRRDDRRDDESDDEQSAETAVAGPTSQPFFAIGDTGGIGDPLGRSGGVA